MLSSLTYSADGTPQVYDLVQLRQTQTPTQIRAVTWTCKFCAGPMTPVLGPTRQWHFRHQPHTSPCPAQGELEPESERHRALKRSAAESLRLHFSPHVVSVNYEVRLPEAGRIADALLTFQDGTRVAVEAQVSPIALEHLQQRTNSYTDVDVDVIWVFVADSQGQLRPGSPWATARDWLVNEGYMVILAQLDVDVTALLLSQ